MTSSDGDVMLDESTSGEWGGVVGTPTLLMSPLVAGKGRCGFYKSPISVSVSSASEINQQAQGNLGDQTSHAQAISFKINHTLH